MSDNENEFSRLREATPTGEKMNNQILKLMVAVFIITGCNKDQKPLTASASIAPKITEITSETTKHLENDLKVCRQFADNMTEFIEQFNRALPKKVKIRKDGKLLYSDTIEVVTLKFRIKDTYHPRHLKIKESFQSKKRAIIANDIFIQLRRFSLDLEPGFHWRHSRYVRRLGKLEKQMKDIGKKFMTMCAH